MADSLPARRHEDRRSVPPHHMPPAGPPHQMPPIGPPPAHLLPVIDQLLSGSTDETASRRLGMSARTFSRRVAELLEYLGTSSRFRGGIEVALRGWVRSGGLPAAAGAEHRFDRVAHRHPLIRGGPMAVVPERGSRDVAEPTTIPDLLRGWARRAPRRPAILVDGQGALTYAEWDARSNAIAHGLLARGVSPGDRIALFFENTEWLDYAVAYFGVLKAGAVAVPLSSRFTGPDLANVLNRCAATGTVWSHHEPSGPGWRATIAELESGQTVEPIRTAATADDIAEILFTSGTTGLPKGVACRHCHVVRPLLDAGDWPPDWWRACATGIYLHGNAVSTAGGQLRLFEPLGPYPMTTLALPTFDPERFCQLAEEHSAAVVQLVPAMATSILESAAHRRHDLSSVRVVSLGCAPIPRPLIPELAAAFPKARLVNMYELSEARYAGTALVYDGTRDGSVGRSRGRTEVRITDDQGVSRPAGEIGEVRLRWRGLPPQHYFRDAEATSQVYVGGWTRTGDLGYLDGDGYLHLVDRLKDVIIKGGINIGSLEIENLLREHPAVADCSVFGVTDPLHGEEVACAVVLRSSASPGELRAFVGERLARHKIPQHVLELDELPRNRSGKVLKGELRSQLTRIAAPAARSFSGR